MEPGCNLASILKYPVALIYGYCYGNLCTGAWNGARRLMLAFPGALLRAAGQDAYAPPLTGIGASYHLLHELRRITLSSQTVFGGYIDIYTLSKSSFLLPG
jgi:hypothetical protein